MNKKTTTPVGYALLHSTIDDHSRLDYSESLNDEKGATAAALWERANAFYASYGIIVKRVLSDNGVCYRSMLFTKALGDTVLKFTHPYRPQTKGKIERSHRTLAFEWAHAPTAPPRPPERLPIKSGSTASMTADPIPASTPNHPPTAYKTSMGRTFSVLCSLRQSQVRHPRSCRRRRLTRRRSALRCRRLWPTFPAASARERASQCRVDPNTTPTLAS